LATGVGTVKELRHGYAVRVPVAVTAKKLRVLSAKLCVSVVEKL
jgi:hypothetical protein